MSGLPSQPPDLLNRRRGLWRLALILSLVALGLWALWLFDPKEVHLPICGLHATTGLHCPGCGTTRATHELLHGRPLSALHYNALWVIGLPLVVYAAASEVGIQLWRRPLWGDLTRRVWFFPAIAATALLFFAVRNIPMEPLLWLAPPG